MLNEKRRLRRVDCRLTREGCLYSAGWVAASLVTPTPGCSRRPWIRADHCQQRMAQEAAVKGKGWCCGGGAHQLESWRRDRVMSVSTAWL